MKRLVFYLTFVLLLCHSGSSYASTMNNAIVDLQQKWAFINYQILDKDEQEQAITNLLDQAARVSKEYPDKAGPLIVQANILCTKAGIEQNSGALDEVEQARDLLLRAVKINPHALNGSAYPLLGWLHTTLHHNALI